ncbi:uncharacterized protein LY89DRAFT_683511 [Mollisia scopiformis]|uniref:Integral membrane protein n=1 Tax=Mollisia scopiformis TaxID=149040 RepID=A0A194XEJ1_MOLSC|nr:uncharacterized protein LY89DRAFT_683511 [Mollisia scopiformis]KUJ18564.1 hypothetical protein LY89DRAFT_683511 [Mollisia scopiformis]
MAAPIVPGLRHLIPVLSSTASVAFCFTEYWTLLPFRRSDIPPESLSHFFDDYFYNTIPGWAGFGLISSISGYLCFRNTTGLARTLYGWGTVLTLGHYAFGPPISKVIKGMIYGPHDKTKGLLKDWLKIHTVRTLMMDIPAMACFVAALSYLL